MDPPMLRLEKKERRNYEMKTTVRYVYLSTLSLYRISRIMSANVKKNLDKSAKK